MLQSIFNSALTLTLGHALTVDDQGNTLAQIELHGLEVAPEVLPHKDVYDHITSLDFEWVKITDHLIPSDCNYDIAGTGSWGASYPEDL